MNITIETGSNSLCSLMASVTKPKKFYSDGVFLVFRLKQLTEMTSISPWCEGEFDLVPFSNLQAACKRFELERILGGFPWNLLRSHEIVFRNISLAFYVDSSEKSCFVSFECLSIGFSLTNFSMRRAIFIHCFIQSKQFE